MCKYANTDIVRITTQQQLNIVCKVLKSKPMAKTAPKHCDTFSPSLWGINTNDTNTSPKRDIK